MKRLLPIHRIHHIAWSYGYRLFWSPLAWFDDYGFRWMSRNRESGRLSRNFHNCTTTGIY